MRGEISALTNPRVGVHREILVHGPANAWPRFPLFFFSAHCCSSVRAQWAPPMQRSMQSFFLFLMLLRVLLTPMRYYTHGRPKWAPLACSSAQFLFLIMWGMIDFYFFLILWVLATIEHCFYTSLTIRTSRWLIFLAPNSGWRRKGGNSALEIFPSLLDFAL